MKRLLLIPCMLIGIALFAQPKAKHKKKKAATSATSDSIPVPPKPTTKYTDNVDDRMKGPNGEKIYIGTSGGRYYMKGNNKVYIPYGTKKKKG